MEKRQALEDKERKKRAREEKRVQRLKMLEEKKKQREETMKRKAEEKQKKAEQQARKASRVSRSCGKRRPPPVQDLPLAKRATLTNESSVINEEDRRAIDRRTRSAKQTTASPDGEGENATQVDNRLANDNEEIDPNTCCMCFVSFEEDVLDGGGAEWIPCLCGRWLHEDCAEGCVTDKSGKERYCPICIDILSVHV